MEKYRELADTEGDALLILNNTGKIVFLNKEVAIKTGHNESELLGKMFTKLLTKTSIMKSLGAFRKTVKGSRVGPFEIEVKKKGGGVITAEAQGTPIKKGGEVIGVFVVVRDLTERRLTEDKLRASEEKYRSIVESSPDGIITANNKGFITSCNSAFLKQSGFSEKEIVGRHMSRLPTIMKRDIPMFLKMFGSWIVGKPPKLLEFKMLNKSGEERLGEVFIVRMKDGGKYKGTQAIVRDITDRKKADDDIKKKTEELERSKLELESKVHDLERFSGLSVGRELKMVELKERIKELEKRLKENSR